MKQTVLGQSPALFQKQLDRRVFLCIAVFATTVGLNILFTACRTEQNHTLMLILNILTDILCGCFLLYTVTVHILPCQRLCRLMCRDKEQLTGSVSHISDSTVRYMDIDCYEVTIGERKLFLPAETMTLAENIDCTYSIVSNIIVEAEQ